MAVDKEYPGDSALSPSDVDVINNVINAKAAFLDSILGALAHFGSDGSEIAIKNVLEGVSQATGVVLTVAAMERVCD